MKLLISKHNNTKAILLAFEDDDIKTLHILNDNSMIFGMYKVWFKVEGKQMHPELQPIIAKYPDVNAVAFLSITKGFVPIKAEEIK